MKLFWCAKTRASRAVWMAEEAGVDYEIVNVDIRDPASPRDPDFTLASPMGKVPAIADGEVFLAESAAICLYLADRYALGRLAPAIDDPRRAQYLFWMLFTPASVEPAMSEKFSGATPNKLQNGWGDFATMIETLQGGVKNKTWLLGDAFSAADVMVGSSASFLRQSGALGDDPPLSEYVDRCEARPAFQKAQAMDQA